MNSCNQSASKLQDGTLFQDFKGNCNEYPGSLYFFATDDGWRGSLEEAWIVAGSGLGRQAGDPPGPRS